MRVGVVVEREQRRSTALAEAPQSALPDVVVRSDNVGIVATDVAFPEGSLTRSAFNADFPRDIPVRDVHDRASNLRRCVYGRMTDKRRHSLTGQHSRRSEHQRTRKSHAARPSMGFPQCTGRRFREPEVDDLPAAI